MSDVNTEVFQGGILVFEIDGQQFDVYRTLVERKSRALAAMMENGMKESQTGVAPLKDTTVATFIRFLEFLMTGDYNPASPEKPSHANLPASSTNAARDKSPEQVENGTIGIHQHTIDRNAFWEPELDDIEVYVSPAWADEPYRKKAKKNRATTNTRNARLWDDDLFQTPNPPSTSKPVTFASVTTDVVIVPAIPANSMFIPNGDWNLDYLGVFLSHAHLYVFADKYEVRDLQRLAARRLEEALNQFQFVPTCSTEFATLFEYVYNDTASRDGKPDVMRIFITNFAAKNMKLLMKCEGFLEMIENSGSVVKDVVVKAVSCL